MGQSSREWCMLSFSAKRIYLRTPLAILPPFYLSSLLPWLGHQSAQQMVALIWGGFYFFLPRLLSLQEQMIPTESEGLIGNLPACPVFRVNSGRLVPASVRVLFSIDKASLKPLQPSTTADCLSVLWQAPVKLNEDASHTCEGGTVLWHCTRVVSFVECSVEPLQCVRSGCVAPGKYL